MPIQRIALISVHTSPLAPMGGAKTGGMNVYIRELSRELGRQGRHASTFSPDAPPRLRTAIDEAIGENVRVIYLAAGPPQPIVAGRAFEHLSEFTANLMAFATLQNVRLRHCLQSLLAERLGGGEAQGSLGHSLCPHVSHARAHEEAHRS